MENAPRRFTPSLLISPAVPTATAVAAGTEPLVPVPEWALQLPQLTSGSITISALPVLSRGHS